MKKPWNRDTLGVQAARGLLPKIRIMDDKTLIGYCELHCHTDRCMFHAEQLNRMIALAGYPDEFVKEVPPGWVSVGPDQMMPLVHLARTLQGVVERLDS